MLEVLQEFQHESTKHVRRLNNVLNTFEQMNKEKYINTL